MNKRNLQIITFILAWIPTIAGLIGLSGIYNPMYGDISEGANILLDNNLRFFNGICIVLGLAIFSIIRNIDARTETFRLVWICIFAGGLCRLLSIIIIGVPPISLIVFMIIEIAGAPFFIYWQNKIAIKK